MAGTSRLDAIEARRAELARGGGRSLPGHGSRVVDVPFRVERTSLPAVPAEVSRPTALVRDKATAKALAERVRQNMAMQARDLIELHDWGWKVLGYKSWRACAIAEFGKSERTVYRYLAAARDEVELETNADPGICQNDKFLGQPSGPMTVGRGRPLKALDEVPPRERGPIIREADDRAKAKGTTRRKELVAVVHEAGYGPAPAAPLGPDVTAAALESMKKPPCSECGRPFD
jgi:hypothetical protein